MMMTQSRQLVTRARTLIQTLLGLGVQAAASHLTMMTPRHSQAPAALTATHTRKLTALGQATEPHLECLENLTAAKIQSTSQTIT